MGQTLTQLTFEEWFTFVFDHPAAVMEPEWYWDPEGDWWDGPARTTIAYLTRAFENARALFTPYTDA